MKTALAWIAGVLAAITGILKFFDKTPADAIGWIESAAKAALNFIAAPVSIPTWALMLLCLFSLLFFISIGIAIYKASCKQRTSWRDYVQDNFFGLVWRWSWGRQFNGVYNLAAYCPTCDIALTANQDYEYDNHGNRRPVTHFNCSECNCVTTLRDGHFDVINDRVERLIDKNARQIAAAKE